MLKQVALMLSLTASGVACTEPDLVYQYEVQGKGEDVSVSYLTDDRGSVDERVSLPWTSDEFEGTAQTSVRLKADGPEGSVVKCLIRHRRIDGDYGANGSGESSQHADNPQEDQTICELHVEQLDPDS